MVDVTPPSSPYRHIMMIPSSRRTVLACVRTTLLCANNTQTVALGDNQLVHSVQPSYAPGGSEDWRYALTIWFCAEDAGAITSDQAMLDSHWPQFQDGGTTGQG